MSGMGSELIGNLVMTFFVSMLPVVELRGAIPMGVASGLGFWESFAAAVAGNLVPVPFIIIFIRTIFEWLRDKNQKFDRLINKFENKAAEKKELIDKYEWFGLVLLVAIPLPGTGAWTGALVAAMMDMRLKRAFPAIALGVCIAGFVVAHATFGAKFLIFG